MMKTILLTLLFYSISFFALPQSINLTFSGTGVVSQIDSIKATNLNTGKSLTLPGNATLMLTGNTGIPTIREQPEQGIVFPNPFSGKATISATFKKPQTVCVEIQNLIGQVLLQKIAFVQSGKNEFYITVQCAGIYIISLTSEVGSSSQKVICSGTNESVTSIQYLGSASDNDHSNSLQTPLKSSLTAYSLGFTPGDIFLFRCMSGDFVTIKTDVPSTTMNYEIEFSGCSDNDGKNYAIVTIGEQTWMADNLAYLPKVNLPANGSNSSGFYYVYNYQGSDIVAARTTENFSKYGVLYNWTAALDACPTGWHLPSDHEWNALVDYLGTSAGEKLKSDSGWAINSTLNNSSGFTATAGGYRSNETYFTCKDLGLGAYYWTSSFSQGNYAHAKMILNPSDEVSLNYIFNSNNGLSVRCLKDGKSTNTIPVANFTVSPLRGTSSTTFQFDASGCSDSETDSKDLEVRWDWNGDGNWDTTFGSTKTNSFRFSDPGGYSVIMEVKDNKGLVDRKTVMVFIGDSIFTDKHDGRDYAYHLIGNQIWMIENMAYLPSVGPPSDASASEPHFYVQDFMAGDVKDAKATDNYSAYGVLYNWEAAKNVCPDGWHLPSDSEWTTLMANSNSYSIMEIGSTHWTNCTKGKNLNGFTALPGGFCDHENGFRNLTQGAYFWSVSEDEEPNSWSHYLLSNDQLVYRKSFAKSNGMSVRCLKGTTETVPTANFTITPPRGTSSTNFLFDATSSTDRGTTLNDLEVRWDFDGDGNWDTDYKKIKNNTWQFPAPGDYPVRLEVKDSSGLLDVETRILTISDGSFMDARDDREYVYKTIGPQTWMAENLAFLPSVNFTSDESATAFRFYIADYDGDEINEALVHPHFGTYGVLYNWPAAMAGDFGSSSDSSVFRGVCPEGWHLPDDEEWASLQYYLGPDAEKKLKSAAGWDEHAGNGDNTSGFNALPAGPESGHQAAFWTSSEGNSGNSIWNRSLGILSTTSSAGTGFIRWAANPEYKSSVRCVKGSSKLLADFTVQPLVGTTSTQFGFDATDCTDSDSVSVNLEVRWDWNSDGTWDTNSTTMKTNSYRFADPGIYSVTMELKDKGGLIGTVTKKVVVGDGTIEDSRDGHQYAYKNIGSQMWLLENLAYLPSVDPPTTTSDTIPYYYVYGNSASNLSDATAMDHYNVYGVLYNKTAALTACPSGWHLPGNEEWNILSGYLGAGAGDKMKSGYLWFENGIGENSCGFSALPGGTNKYGEGFTGLNQNAGFWSVTNINDSTGRSENLYFNQHELIENNLSKRNGLSVRCIKNGYTTPKASFTVDPPSGTITTNFLFDASLSFDPETNIFDLLVRWDWNADGTWDTDYEKSKKRFHQYQDSGTYTVILEVKDGDGAVNSFTKTVIAYDGQLTDGRDGQEYFYIIIGNQAWMAENLAWMPKVSPSTANSEKDPQFHVYKYMGTNIDEGKADDKYTTYGVLYNWPAAMNGASGSTMVTSEIQGVCPAGWHLPNDAEWTVLTDFLGPSAGSEMKASSGWKIGDAVNSSAFTALPGGYRSQNTKFYYEGSSAYFWSSSADGSTNALYRSLDGYSDIVIRYSNSRAYGYSVRCLRD